MTGPVVWVYATNDEYAYLTCRDCGDELLSDDPGSTAATSADIGALALTLVFHAVKHAMVADWKAAGGGQGTGDVEHTLRQLADRLAAGGR